MCYHFLLAFITDRLMRLKNDEETFPLAPIDTPAPFPQHPLGQLGAGIGGQW